MLTQTRKITRPVTVATWWEVEADFLVEHPPPPGRGTHTATFRMNRVDARARRGTGQATRWWLVRRPEFEFLASATEDGLDAQIAAFLGRDDVRLLRPGLRADDRDALPARVADPGAALLDGDDAGLYLDKRAVLAGVGGGV